MPNLWGRTWNYPGMVELGLTTKQYEERFFTRHPFMFADCHDDGDEDPCAWIEDNPIGGYVASFNRNMFGNQTEKWMKD